MMASTEERLAVLEKSQGDHIRNFEDIRDALEKLVETTRKLTEAEIRREKDQDTFRRIFGELKQLREDFTVLQTAVNKEKESLETYKEEQLKEKLKSAQSEIKDKNKHIWDVRSIIVSSVVMLILWLIAEKLGIHIVG